MLIFKESFSFKNIIHLCETDIYTLSMMDENYRFLGCLNS